MTYREHAPCAALAPYVECFWTLGNPAGHAPENRVLPDGCMDVIVAVDAGGTCTPTAVGTMTTALVIPRDDVPARVGVRFRPGGAPAFLRVDAPVLVDRTVALGDVWSADTLRPLCDAPSRERLEATLLARLDGVRVDRRVAWVVRRIAATRGLVAMDALAAGVDWSPRQLRRRVEAVVGIGPKRLGRIVRLRALLDEAARSPAPRWADLAAGAGFFDQAHLVRECRALAGETPTAWWTRQAMAVSSKTMPSDPA